MKSKVSENTAKYQPVVELDRNATGYFAPIPGYTEADRPIFAAPGEAMCGRNSFTTPSADWCCLLRVGHSGGHWFSNPEWLFNNVDAGKLKRQ